MSTTSLVHPRPDSVGPMVLNIVGIGLLIAAWIGADGESVASQLPFVNLGVVGVIVCGAGNALYLFGWRMAIRRRRRIVARHPHVAGAETKTEVLS